MLAAHTHADVVFSDKQDTDGHNNLDLLLYNRAVHLITGTLFSTFQLHQLDGDQIKEANVVYARRKVCCQTCITIGQ